MLETPRRGCPARWAFVHYIEKFCLEEEENAKSSGHRDSVTFLFWLHCHRIGRDQSAKMERCRCIVQHVLQNVEWLQRRLCNSWKRWSATNERRNTCLFLFTRDQYWQRGAALRWFQTPAPPAKLSGLTLTERAAVVAANGPKNQRTIPKNSKLPANNNSDK